MKCVTHSVKSKLKESLYKWQVYSKTVLAEYQLVGHNLQLKSMEEEVLIKNGEIKILRDSLHQTESILEEQRRSHFLLEQEKTQALNEKEKEFSKKVTHNICFAMDSSFAYSLNSIRSNNQAGWGGACL